MDTAQLLKSATLAAILVTMTACGGGGGGSDHDEGGSSTAPAPTIPQGSSGDSATLDQATYSGEKRSAFNTLNAARAAAGLPPVKQNTRLDQAAQAHADYMAINGQTEGHSETEGKPGFTGIDASYRAKAAGYTNWLFVGEGIGGATTDGGVSLEDTAQLGMHSQIRVPYHRVSALSPRLADIGYGTTTEKENSFETIQLTINYGYSPEPRPIQGGYFVWPVDNATKIPVYMGGEIPDPAPDLLDNQRGYPVSITTNPGDNITVNLFKMNCAGNDLPARIITKENDIHQRLANNWIFLLTELALPSNTICSVSFQGSSPALGSFNKTWSFTTAQ